MEVAAVPRICEFSGKKNQVEGNKVFAARPPEEGPAASGHKTDRHFRRLHLQGEPAEGSASIVEGKGAPRSALHEKS
jgi:hypothetical protein